MRRFIAIAVLFAACHRHESPTAPELPLPLGALGDSTLTGQVKSAEGQTVASVRLKAYKAASDIEYGGLTDANGQYFIGDMWHGDYTIVVYLPNDPNPFTSLRMTVQRGDNYKLILLPHGTLPAPGCTYVSGHVTDAISGAPVQSAQIAFFEHVTSSAADGSYVIDLGCPPNADPTARYVLRVEHPSYSTSIIDSGIPDRSWLMDVHMQPR
jgi:hypothetical protein